MRRASLISLTRSTCRYALHKMHKYYDNKDIAILWRRNRGEVQMRNYRIDICRVNMAERVDDQGCVDELSYAGLKVNTVARVLSGLL